jgi:hypothetical protein
MKLPSELLYAIINQCIEQDLKQCYYMIGPDAKPTTAQLVLLSQVAYSFIVQNSSYHRLRLWKLLCQIPKQVEPIQLAVGHGDNFTLLKVQVQCERISRNYENFLVLEERMKRHCEPSKWIKHCMYLEHTKHMTKLPYFDMQHFLNDLRCFTNQNTMSIWLWKRRSHTFFTLNQTKDAFCAILDTQQKSLMAWDHQEGLTEAVMLYNTELFGRLL